MSVPTEKLVVNKLTTLKPPKKLKPARKQVKPGEVEKKETPQTGKEYSKWLNLPWELNLNSPLRYLV
jgi:hypothetical protein